MIEGMDELARMQIEDGEKVVYSHGVVTKFSAAPPINSTGIYPTEFKVLILPDAVEEKKGSIFIPEMVKDTEKYATTQGLLIDVAPAAFKFIDPDEWGDGKPPQVGQRVIFAKYAGLRVTSKRDGREYLLMADKDIVATIED